MNTYSRRQIAMVIVDVGTGLTAVAGGIGLIGGGITLPREWLQGSPFGDYVVPGLILGIVVGGSCLVAALAVISASHQLSDIVSAAAGATLIGWIVVEVAIVGYVSWMQPFMFAVGVLIMALAMADWRTDIQWLERRLHVHARSS